MRILHVLPQLSPGGMENLVIQLAGDATRRGDHVAVASGPGDWRLRVVQAGAEYVALPGSSRRDAFSMAAIAARLAGCIRQLRPDVVHSHNVRATALSRLALIGSRHRAALMPTLHGLHPADYPAASRVLRRVATRVITCAPSVARSLEAAGFPSARIDVITNGAVLQPADLRRQRELRQRLRLGGTPLVLGIGRLVGQKDWPAFIAAAGQLKGHPFVVAGDGPLLVDLTELARQSGGRVRFLGPVDDIAALVGLSACVVSTSQWEGLPLALLEALSLGAPVVATAVDGVTDVIPSDAALLVPPGDPGAVSAAISRILTCPPLADELRQKARAASVAWRPERMLLDYEHAYRAAESGAMPWV
ncbi:MAG: glycosyltransferase family 4 protein [Streptosporangiaceae bacterium]